MTKLLEDDLRSFLEGLNSKSLKGIRINNLKINTNDFLNISNFKLDPIPWCESGFYIDPELRPGKHPHYHLGLYYIQEPSAMIPVEVLNPSPGDRVLDLCAAPGGKSTQILSHLNGEGLLVSNDISPKRVKSLSKNIQMTGAKNVFITNETPERLAPNFQNFFDKILVDAPCSGEGMFGRDLKAHKIWTSKYSDDFSSIQKEILTSAATMLKDGGHIVYSTCTFSPEENELKINWFLNNHPEFEAVLPDGFEMLSHGNKSYADFSYDINKSLRAYPHLIKGDGHFITLLRKKGNAKKSDSHIKFTDAPDLFKAFEADFLNFEVKGKFLIKKDKLFLIDQNMPDYFGIKVEYPGLFLGTLKKSVFVPSQAFAMTLSEKDVKQSINFSSDSQEAIKYLKGETIIVSGEKGWHLVLIDNFPAGFAKQTGTFLKNSYDVSWKMS